MSSELSYDHDLSAILYAIRFQLDGDVFLTNGASDEVWGTGARDAADYAVTMTETTVGESGHYVGDFDTSANIAVGVYPVTIFLRAGGAPVNSDRPLGRGIMYWDGAAEINIFTLDANQNTIITDMSALTASGSKVNTVFGPGE